MGAGDIPAGRGYSRWAGGYPRRPGIFPIGLGIFPPAGDIPDGSEDKGVKGTFPVSGGNIPGGPGISPACPGTLPRTGSRDSDCFDSVNQWDGIVVFVGFRWFDSGPAVLIV